jgi:hypothetical protein
MISLKGVNPLVCVTLGQVVSFLFWKEDMGILHIPNSTSWGPSDGTERSSSPLPKKPYIPWRNETTRDELITNEMQKYIKKSDDEVDLLHGIGFQGVIRMIDPMGGRTHRCLEKHFQYWANITEDIPREPVFESFFEWLDYGEGRNIEMGSFCSKRVFDEKRYLKYTATERARTELRFDVDEIGRISRAFYAYSNQTVNSGVYVFVWGRDRKIYILDESKRDDRRIGHATFFCGRPVLHAGELRIRHGTIAWISDRSGHYKPTLSNHRNLYEFLRFEKGINVKTLEWRSGDGELDPNWVSALARNQRVLDRDLREGTPGRLSVPHIPI